MAGNPAEWDFASSLQLHALLKKSHYQYLRASIYLFLDQKLHSEEAVYSNFRIIILSQSQYMTLYLVNKSKLLLTPHYKLKFWQRQNRYKQAEQKS